MALGTKHHKNYFEFVRNDFNEHCNTIKFSESNDLAGIGIGIGNPGNCDFLDIISQKFYEKHCFKKNL